MDWLECPNSLTCLAIRPGRKKQGILIMESQRKKRFRDEPDFSLWLTAFSENECEAEVFKSYFGSALSERTVIELHPTIPSSPDDIGSIPLLESNLSWRSHKSGSGTTVKSIQFRRGKNKKPNMQRPKRRGRNKNREGGVSTQALQSTSNGSRRLFYLSLSLLIPGLGSLWIS